MNEAERHCATKLTITIEEMRWLWAEASDNQRMQIIKSVIYTAPDAHGFYRLARGMINSEKFQESID